MSFGTAFLAVSICVGTFHCRPDLLLSEASPLPMLSILQPKTFVVTHCVDYYSGESKQNSCPSITPDRLPYLPFRDQSNLCYSPRNQIDHYIYTNNSSSDLSVVVVRNTTAGTLPSRIQRPAERHVLWLVKEAAIHILSHILVAITSSSIPTLISSGLWLYFTGSLFFDVAHYFLHKFSKSPYWIFRRIGYLHEVHHLYFNRRLKFNDRYLWQNMLCELPVELSCQLFGTWLGYQAAQALSLTRPGLLSRELFHLVLIFEVIRSVVVAIFEGRDSNHQSYSIAVPKDPHSFLVGPEYHAMHHINPSAYISSSFRVFDWVLGTAYTLRSRRVTTTGLSGAFGQAIKRELLSAEFVNCIQELSIHESCEKMREAFTKTDILIIGQEDSTNSRCQSVIEAIELFRKHNRPRPGHYLLLPEVWYIDSHSEMSSSPEAKTTFTPHARMYYDGEDIIYRHIVLSKSTSKFGTAFLRQDFSANVALWLIRRGARYIPVVDPLSAVWGYFKFFYGI